MNPDSPLPPRDELEVSLTALILGELPAQETARLLEAIQRDPELTALHQRLIETVALVKTANSVTTPENVAPLKLSNGKRDQLLQKFKTISPVELHPWRARFTRWAVPVGIAALLAAILGHLTLRQPPLGAVAKYEARTAISAPSAQFSPNPSKPAYDDHTLTVERAGDKINDSDSGLTSSRKQPIYLPGATVRDEFRDKAAGKWSSGDSFGLAIVTEDQKLGSDKSGARGTTHYSLDSLEARQTPLVPPPGDLPLVGRLFRAESEKSAVAKDREVRNDITVFDDRVDLSERARSELRSSGSLKPAERPAGQLNFETANRTASETAVDTVKSGNGSLDVVNGPVNANRDMLGWSGNSGGMGGFGGGGFGYNGSMGGYGGGLAGYYKYDKRAEDLAITGVVTVPADTWDANVLQAQPAEEDDGRDLVVKSYTSQPQSVPRSTLSSIAGGGAPGRRIDPPVRRQPRATTTEEARKPDPTRSPALPLDGKSSYEVAFADGHSGQLADNEIYWGKTKQLGEKEAKKVTTAPLPTARTVDNSKALAQRQEGFAGYLGNVLQDNAPVVATNSLALAAGDKFYFTQDADAPAPRPPTPAPEPQPEINTAQNPFSTFSMNVADVSFKLAAAALEKGTWPDPATVRAEEFLNAFDYRDPEPPRGSPIGFAWERARSPFAQNRDLLRFSIKTAAQGRAANQPLNLVLLLDNSGSMERSDRVRIIHECLRVLAGQLTPQDRLSIVTFSRTARLWVDGVTGGAAAVQAVDQAARLAPQGGTNLEEAMALGYSTAIRHYMPRGMNRVVLLTDGAANLGNTDPTALKQLVENRRRQGIALDCFGIGWEGYNDSLLETLARNGDGRYGFVNSPEEAATGFAAQLAGALRTAAADVKVQVEFNPARVRTYRQIGYDRLQLTKEQFRDNTVDAGEMSATEAGNALYVLQVQPEGSGPLATVRVRYKVPGTRNYREQQWQVPYTGSAPALDQAGPAMRLAGTAASFAEWLTSSPYAAEVSSDRLLGILRDVPSVYGPDTRPAKLEWMIRQAKSISGK